MAKARQRRRRQQRQPSAAGWPRGLAMGAVLLIVAGAVAWYRQAAPDPERDPEPAAKAVELPVAAAPAAATPKRFEFYDMLPDAEVQVSDEPEASRRNDLAPLSVPGAYVLQAGAFPGFAEADKVKAKLALLGVVSEIQKAEANGAVFHRVRIGPIENLDELNRLRNRLRHNGIDFLVIPVGE